MKPAVLCVHQIGKVGSTSVASALQARFPAREVYQTHVLSDSGVLNGMAWWLGRPGAPRCKFPDHLSRSIELRRRFAGGFSAVRWFLVCLVRDPLCCDVSAFFQNLRVHWIHRLPEKSGSLCRHVLAGKNSSHGLDGEDLEELVGDLAGLFVNEYPVDLFDQWFDHEMRGVFGIDVFARPFSRQRGYEIYQHGDARAVLMRMEDLSHVFVNAIGEWLSNSELADEPGAPLALEQRANDGSAKPYAALYERFLERIRVEPKAAARSGLSRVARHFYPEEAGS